MSCRSRDSATRSSRSRSWTCRFRTRYMSACSCARDTTPAKRELVAYREYLGSNLEILDVATGNATIVHQYRGSFQAPNWTPDGKTVICAQEGHLYRFDLATRTPEVINTGFATRNNNDHVLSFDG